MEILAYCIKGTIEIIDIILCLCIYWGILVKTIFYID